MVLVQGNLIGLGLDGSTALGNLETGIKVDGTAGATPAATIGGVNAGEGNVISANGASGDNGSAGIYLDEATGILIAADLIGTDATGTLGRGNFGSGILLDGASSNFIGVGNGFDGGGNLVARYGNVIGDTQATSGGGGEGIRLQDGSTDNAIDGNFIGLGADGTSLFGNAGDGVMISNSIDNSVNSAAVSASNANFIAANAGWGVHIDGAGSLGNSIGGNRIGLTLDGMHVAANGSGGIKIINDATENTLSGNTLMGSNGAGIGVLIQGDGTVGGFNVVENNRIGTFIDGSSTIDAAGSGAFSFLYGVKIDDSSNNMIGADTATGNVIVASEKAGIGVFSDGSNHNTFAGNSIGVLADGVTAAPNQDGIDVGDRSGANLIGGDNAVSTVLTGGNLISGNLGRGIVIGATSGSPVILSDSGSANQVIGNFIGTDVTGTAAVPNGQGGVLITDNISDTQVGALMPATARAT